MSQRKHDYLNEKQEQVDADYEALQDELSDLQTTILNADLGYWTPAWNVDLTAMRERAEEIRRILSN